MGFDINSPSNKPVIREAASMHNDGGGGNLGYFEQGEHKDKKHKEDSIFLKEKEVDTFVKESDSAEIEENASVSKLIAGFISRLKKWVKRLFQ